MRRSLLLMVACLTVTSAQAATLLWGPYLQDVAADHASILWATRAGDGAATVRYSALGEAPKLLTPRVTVLAPALTQLGETAWLQRVDLTGLTPATRYLYELALDGQAVTSGLVPAFSTAPLTTQANRPFRVLALGDSGDDGGPQLTLAAALEQEQASFFIHVGDIAYFDGKFQQFADYFFAIYPSLLSRTPLFPVAGNHDYPSDALPYRTLFTPSRTGVPEEGWNRYYSYDWGNAHFVAIDTNTPLDQAIAGNGAMLAWLERDLRETKQTWRIVYFHHPPFPSSAAKLNDPVCDLVRQYITPILERQAVHLVLNGHEHIYQRTKPRRAGEFSAPGPGTVYVTTGGGGSQIYDPGNADFIAAATGVSHYLRLDFSNTELKGQAVGPNGEIYDQWTISAAPVPLDPPVLNAAAFTTAVAPGGLVSLFGWNFSPADATPGTTKVFVNGLQVPLIYASRTQLNAQLPFDITGAAEVEVRSAGGSAKRPFTVGTQAPAIFAIPDGSASVAAAIHVDGRLITRAAPAAAGEWVAVYLTGLGAVNGTIAAGQLAPLSPLYLTKATVRALVGGVDAEVAVACLAPGFFGLYQVNLRVPPATAPGVRTLQIIAGGIAGNTLELPVR